MVVDEESLTVMSVPQVFWLKRHRLYKLLSWLHIHQRRPINTYHLKSVLRGHGCNCMACVTIYEVSMCVCVCVGRGGACVHACVCACVRARARERVCMCVRACVCVCVWCVCVCVCGEGVAGWGESERWVHTCWDAKTCSPTRPFRVEVLSGEPYS